MDVPNIIPAREIVTPVPWVAPAHRVKLAEAKCVVPTSEPLPVVHSRGNYSYPWPVLASNREQGVPVSILMPVLPPAPWFFKAIESILQQTHRNWQLVIVCEGDAGPLSWCLNDERITLIQGRGKGLAAALNLGLKACKHELVARMDADDVMDPERIERQVAAFIANPRIDILGTQIDFGAETTHHPRRPSYRDFRENPWMINHPSVMFRAASIRWLGGYDESLQAAEDLELWLRASQLGLWIENLPEVLLTHRLHKDQACHRRVHEETVNRIAASFPMPKIRGAIIARGLFYGGAEVWVQHLTRATADMIDWSVVGIDAFPNSAADNVQARTIQGLDKAREVLEAADLLLVWTMQDLRPYGKKRIVLVTHTANDDPFASYLDEVQGLEHVQRAIGVSQFASEMLRKHLRCEIRTINNAIPVALNVPFIPKEHWRRLYGFSDDKLIGYLGRMHKEKGWPEFLAAVSELKMQAAVRGQEWPPERMPECIRRVYSQTEGRVRVLGWSNDVVNFLGAIDALVLPSQYESFGYVIAEAWCAGLPIASTLVGIAKERPRWVAPIEQPVTPETVKDAIIRLSGAKCLVDVQTARKRFDVKPWREAWLDALCD